MAKNKDERTNRLGDLPDDAEWIRRCLRELEWTQQRGADESGISQPNFNAFLNGKRPLPRVASARLLEAIGRGFDAKRAADAVSQKPRLTPEAAARIRSRANKVLGAEPDRAEDKTPPLTFEQAKEMSAAEVISIVGREISTGPMNILLSLRQTDEEREAAIEAQLLADPRVHIAGAKEWIRHV